MFDKFKQGAEMVKAANKLRQLQNDISKQRFAIEENGVKVVVSGDLKVKELEIDTDNMSRVVDTINKALKEAQETVGKRMQEEMGGLQNLLGSLK
ncbi:MAG: YbaB/EbfC family nucleoid-associated protein [bacterium]|nr:YbaB/EbfC family nucleoid-associated protein [bacterium]